MLRYILPVVGVVVTTGGWLWAWQDGALGSREVPAFLHATGATGLAVGIAAFYLYLRKPTAHAHSPCSWQLRTLEFAGLVVFLGFFTVWAWVLLMRDPSPMSRPRALTQSTIATALNCLALVGNLFFRRNRGPIVREERSIT
jgi:hypothetical protein